MGCCPFHAEKTPSFHVSDTRGTFKCFGCGQQGDIFDWLMLSKGLSFQEALEELSGSAPARFVSDPIERHHIVRNVASDDDTRRIRHAHELWLKAQSIKDTVAERYLRATRGIMGNVPDILKYAPSAYCSVLQEETEALIAPLQDGNGHVTAVQQIFLCRETDDAWRDLAGKRVKRTLGAMRAASVRMGTPDTTLGLAGSVEDALAASALYSLPVWASCGEQRMARVWVPEEVEEIIVFADTDEPGRKAAQEVRRAHQGRRRVSIMYPDGIKDWAGETEKRLANG